MNKQYRLLAALTCIVGLLYMLGQGFSGPISLVTGSPESDVAQLLLGILFFFITLLTAKVFKIEIIHGYLERVLKVNVPALIGDIFSAVVLFIGICLILSLVFKQNISALLVTGAGSAAILGFALKDFAVALAVGISLNFEDTYKVGDRIKIQTRTMTHEGIVQKITWRNTVILSDLLETIFIPNIAIVESSITNYDLPERQVKRNLMIEIDYDVSIDSAERILYAGTLNAVGVKFYAPPVVRAVELKESGVLYEIRFSISDMRDRSSSQHAIIKSVLESLRVANIMVARSLDFNQNLKISNRAHDIYYLVHQVSLFSSFPQEALSDLANALVPRRFEVSSRIVHVGESLDAIFIVAEGIVSRAYLGHHEHISQQRFIAAEFFGEEALISGLSHQSTVSADTNVLLYQLNKEVLQILLNKYPTLLKQLATNLAMAQITQKSNFINEKSNILEYQQSLYEGMLNANFNIIN
jgi:small-conductance mechanosensitive channel